MADKFIFRFKIGSFEVCAYEHICHTVLVKYIKCGGQLGKAAAYFGE